MGRTLLSVVIAAEFMIECDCWRCGWQATAVLPTVLERRRTGVSVPQLSSIAVQFPQSAACPQDEMNPLKLIQPILHDSVQEFCFRNRNACWAGSSL